MQKLLRRCPPGPSSHLPLCTSSSSPSSKPLFLSPLLFPTHNRFNSHLGFSPTPLIPPLMPLPSSSTSSPTSSFHFRPFSLSSSSSKPASFSAAAGRATAVGSCRICRCSIEDVTNPQRPWVVFKEIRRGSRLAWLHTAAGNVGGGLGLGEGGGGDGDGEERENEKKLHRRVRLRGGSRSGGADSGPPRNPDLLTIPGVGPRNLRKLAEKGIGGVAELKKLYKDKVMD